MTLVSSLRRQALPTDRSTCRSRCTRNSVSCRCNVAAARKTDSDSNRTPWCIRSTRSSPYRYCRRSSPPRSRCTLGTAASARYRSRLSKCDNSDGGESIREKAFAENCGTTKFLFAIERLVFSVSQREKNKKNSSRSFPSLLSWAWSKPLLT